MPYKQDVYTATVLVKVTVSQCADSEQEFRENISNDFCNMDFEDTLLLGECGGIKNLTEEAKEAEREEQQLTADYMRHEQLESLQSIRI